MCQIIDNLILQKNTCLHALSIRPLKMSEIARFTCNFLMRMFLYLCMCLFVAVFVVFVHVVECVPVALFRQTVASEVRNAAAGHRSYERVDGIGFNLHVSYRMSCA